MNPLEQDFWAFLRQFSSISEEEFAAFITYFTSRILQKGEFFFRRDSICCEVAYIHTGISRTFYHTKNGADVTSCFCTENCFTTSFRNVISHTPAQMNLLPLTVQ